MASDGRWAEVQHSTPALVHKIHSSVPSFQQLIILWIDQLLKLLGTWHARYLDRSCPDVDGSEKRRNLVDFEIGEHRSAFCGIGQFGNWRALRPALSRF